MVYRSAPLDRWRCTMTPKVERINRNVENILNSNFGEKKIISMSKKALIITGDAVEALEIYDPYFRCLEEGLDVQIAAPSKRSCKQSFRICPPDK